MLLFKNETTKKIPQRPMFVWKMYHMQHTASDLTFFILDLRSSTTLPLWCAYSSAHHQRTYIYKYCRGDWCRQTRKNDLFVFNKDKTKINIIRNYLFIFIMSLTYVVSSRFLFIKLCNDVCNNHRGFKTSGEYGMVCNYLKLYF